MVRLLLKWLLYAFGLLVTARLVPGFHVRSVAAALIAMLVIVSGAVPLLPSVTVWFSISFGVNISSDGE